MKRPFDAIAQDGFPNYGTSKAPSLGLSMAGGLPSAAGMPPPKAFGGLAAGPPPAGAAPQAFLGARPMAVPGGPAGFPPRLPGLPLDGGGGSSSSSATAAPGGAGLTESVEIPQGKVNLVVGEQTATIRALRALTGAEVNVKPNAPSVEKATVSITGKQGEIDKCKALVNALVNGEELAAAGVDAASLLSAAGVGGAPASAPALGGLNLPPGLGGPSMPKLPGAGAGGAASLGANAAPTPAGLAALGGADPNKLQALLAAARSSLSGSSNLGNLGLNPGLLVQALQLAGGAAGQTTSAATVAAEPERKRQEPVAFDREALARLAKQAAETPAPVPEVVKEEVPAPTPMSVSIPVAPKAAPEPPQDAGPAAPTRADPAPAAASSAPTQAAVAPPLPPPTVAFRFGAPAKAEPAGGRKDSSAVLSILQMAQNNAARGRAGGRTGDGAPVASSNASAGMATNDSGKSAQWDALLQQLQAETIPDSSKAGLEKEVLAVMKQVEPQRVAELVSCVRKLEALRSDRLLEDMCQAAVSIVPRCSGSVLTQLTVSFASWIKPQEDARVVEDKESLPEGVRAFFTGAAAEVNKHLMDIGPADLSKVANALARMGFGMVKLFSTIARIAAQRRDRFQPAELIALVAAFDKARLHHTGLMDALVQRLKVVVKEIPAQEILKALRYLANASVRDEDLGQAVMDVMAKKPLPAGLTTEEYCRLAWSLCGVMEVYNEKLAKGIFRSLEDVDQFASDARCELYELHLALEAEHSKSYSSYGLGSKTTSNLRHHYQKHHAKSSRFLKMERASERCHSEIAELLQKVVKGSVAQKFETSDGLVADIGVSKKKSSSSSSSSVMVLIEIDGPHVFHQSLDPVDSPSGGKPRVRGAVALKRRILQKIGHRIAVISEDDWRAREDPKAKREYLRNALEQAGVSKERLV